MKKMIKIVPYDKNWPIIFENEAEKIKNLLKENFVDIHHVGSTSVPGLCAKPQIDIFCVVKDLKRAIKALTEAGFTYKGEYNLPLRLFFSKKTPNDLNLHVATADSGELAWQITFRNFLRKNKEARDLYAKTKLDLVNDNPQGFNVKANKFSDYTVKKGDVIRKISKMANFNGTRFLIANNEYEIEDFKKLLPNVNINPNDQNEFSLCIYSGTKCVCAALLIFDYENKIAKIEFISETEPKYQNIMIDKIKAFTEFHDLKLKNSEII